MTINLRKRFSPPKKCFIFIPVVRCDVSRLIKMASLSERFRQTYLTKVQTASGTALTYPAKETVNNHDWLHLFSSRCIKCCSICSSEWKIASLPDINRNDTLFSLFLWHLDGVVPGLLTGSRPYISTDTYRPALV